MNGLLLPYFDRHLSLKLPKIGVTKKPMRGLRAQTRVMCWWSTPIFNKVGETNAVSAAYENSIPITAADTRTNSARVFFLQRVRPSVGSWQLSVSSRRCVASRHAYVCRRVERKVKSVDEFYTFDLTGIRVKNLDLVLYSTRHEGETFRTSNSGFEKW